MSIQYSTIVPCLNFPLRLLVQMETFEDSQRSPNWFSEKAWSWSSQDEIWSVSMNCDVSLVFVAGRLLSADHIQGWKSAYTGRWITKPRCPCRSPRTGCSWGTGTSCLTAFSIFAIVANARSAWCT